MAQTTTAQKDKAEPAAPAGRKKTIPLIAGLVALVLAAEAAYMFLLKPSTTEGAEAEPAEVGEVIRLDPITINLAEGRYLKLGLALQTAYGLKEAPDGSQALDLAISRFSGRPFAELSTSEGREQAKAELTEQVAEAYHDEILEVYFTEFVTQ